MALHYVQHIFRSNCRGKGCEHCVVSVNRDDLITSSPWAEAVHKPP